MAVLIKTEYSGPPGLLSMQKLVEAVGGGSPGGSARGLEIAALACFCCLNIILEEAVG